MPFRYTFTLTEQDAYDFSMHHLKHSSAMKRQILAVRVAFTVIVLAVMFLMMMRNDNLVLALIIAAFEMLIFQLLVHPIMKWSYIRNLKSHKKSGRLAYDKEITFEFGEDTLNEITPDTSSSAKYSMFQRVESGETAIYLYVTAMTAQLIPHRVFPAPQDREAFLAFIRGKIETA